MDRSDDGKWIECRFKEDDGTVDCKWRQSADKEKRSTGSMVNHVEAVHKDDSPKSFAECKKRLDSFKEGKKAKIDSAAASQQAGLRDFLVPSSAAGTCQPTSMKDMKRKKSIDAALTMWVAASPHAAYRVVQDPGFKELIRRLDPRWPLPSRMTVGRNVINLGEECFKLIIKQLNDAGSITVGVDLWSRGTGEPDMGIHTTH